MRKLIFKHIALILCFLLCFEQSGFAQMAMELDISGHLSALRNSLVTDKFRPVHLRYLDYNAVANKFNLLLDKGDGISKESGVGSQERKDGNSQLESQTKNLLNYFFTGITLPNESFWVNLRPDSPDSIIDKEVEQTDIGRIFLEADLQLKKDTSSATSPQTPEGKEYWDKLYKKAEELYGSQNVTIPTLTRPWIVPGEIIVRETVEGSQVTGHKSQVNPSAYIYKATLKVMLEEDYLNSQPGGDIFRQSYNEAKNRKVSPITSSHSFSDERAKELNEYSTQLIRELIIPKLTKEVNSAKRYAPLRQVYYSLIMAQWFKQRYSGKSGVYCSLIDRHNLKGLISRESWDKDTYFTAYKQSFQQGEYNIKEPISTPTGQVIRSYMSGGIEFAGISKAVADSAIVTAKALPDSVVVSPMNAGIKVSGSSSLENPAAVTLSFSAANSAITEKKQPFSESEVKKDQKVVVASLAEDNSTEVKNVSSLIAPKAESAEGNKVSSAVSSVVSHALKNARWNMKVYLHKIGLKDYFGPSKLRPYLEKIYPDYYQEKIKSIENTLTTKTDAKQTIQAGLIFTSYLIEVLDFSPSSSFLKTTIQTISDSSDSKDRFLAFLDFAKETENVRLANVFFVTAQNYKELIKNFIFLEQRLKKFGVNGYYANRLLDFVYSLEEFDSRGGKPELINALLDALEQAGVLKGYVGVVMNALSEQMATSIRREKTSEVVSKINLVITQSALVANFVEALKSLNCPEAQINILLDNLMRAENPIEKIKSLMEDNNAAILVSIIKQAHTSWLENNFRARVSFSYYKALEFFGIHEVSNEQMIMEKFIEGLLLSEDYKAQFAQLQAPQVIDELISFVSKAFRGNKRYLNKEALCLIVRLQNIKAVVSDLDEVYRKIINTGFYARNKRDYIPGVIISLLEAPENISKFKEDQVVNHLLDAVNGLEQFGVIPSYVEQLFPVLLSVYNLKDFTPAFIELITSFRRNKIFYHVNKHSKDGDVWHISGIKDFLSLLAQHSNRNPIETNLTVFSSLCDFLGSENEIEEYRLGKEKVLMALARASNPKERAEEYMRDSPKASLVALYMLNPRNHTKNMSGWYALLSGSDSELFYNLLVAPDTKENAEALVDLWKSFPAAREDLMLAISRTQNPKETARLFLGLIQTLKDIAPDNILHEILSAIIALEKPTGMRVNFEQTDKQIDRGFEYDHMEGLNNFTKLASALSKILFTKDSRSLLSVVDLLHELASSSEPSKYSAKIIKVFEPLQQAREHLSSEERKLLPQSGFYELLFYFFIPENWKKVDNFVTKGGIGSYLSIVKDFVQISLKFGYFTAGHKIIRNLLATADPAQTAQGFIEKDGIKAVKSLIGFYHYSGGKPDEIISNLVKHSIISDFTKNVEALLKLAAQIGRAPWFVDNPKAYKITSALKDMVLPYLASTKEPYKVIANILQEEQSLRHNFNEVLVEMSGAQNTNCVAATQYLLEEGDAHQKESALRKISDNPELKAALIDKLDINTFIANFEVIVTTFNPTITDYTEKIKSDFTLFSYPYFVVRPLLEGSLNATLLTSQGDFLAAIKSHTGLTNEFVNYLGNRQDIFISNQERIIKTLNPEIFGYIENIKADFAVLDNPSHLIHPLLVGSLNTALIANQGNFLKAIKSNPEETKKLISYLRNQKQDIFWNNLELTITTLNPEIADYTEKIKSYFPVIGKPGFLITPLLDGSLNTALIASRGNLLEAIKSDTVLTHTFILYISDKPDIFTVNLELMVKTFNPGIAIYIDKIKADFAMLGSPAFLIGELLDGSLNDVIIASRGNLTELALDKLKENPKLKPKFIDSLNVDMFIANFESIVKALNPEIADYTTTIKADFARLGNPALLIPSLLDGSLNTALIQRQGFLLELIKSDEVLKMKLNSYYSHNRPDIFISNMNSILLALNLEIAGYVEKIKAGLSLFGNPDFLIAGLLNGSLNEALIQNRGSLVEAIKVNTVLTDNLSRHLSGKNPQVFIANFEAIVNAFNPGIAGSYIDKIKNHFVVLGNPGFLVSGLLDGTLKDSLIASQGNLVQVIMERTYLIIDFIFYLRAPGRESFGDMKIKEKDLIDKLTEYLKGSVLKDSERLGIYNFFMRENIPDKDKASIARIFLSSHSLFKDLRSLVDKQTSSIRSDLEYLGLVNQLISFFQVANYLSTEERDYYEELIGLLDELIIDRYKKWPKGGVSYLEEILSTQKQYRLFLQSNLSALKRYNSYFSHYSKALFDEFSNVPEGQEEQFAESVKKMSESILAGKSYKEVRELLAQGGSSNEQFIYDLLMLVSPKFRAGVGDEELKRNLAYGVNKEDQWRGHIVNFLKSINPKEAAQLKNVILTDSSIKILEELLIIEKVRKDNTELNKNEITALMAILNERKEKKGLVETLKPLALESQEAYLERIREGYLAWLGNNQYVIDRIAQIKEAFDKKEDLIAMSLLETLIVDGFKDILRESPETKGKEFNRLLESLSILFELTEDKVAQKNKDIASDFAGTKSRVVGKNSKGKIKELIKLQVDAKVKSEQELRQAYGNKIRRFAIAKTQEETIERWGQIILELKNRDIEAADILEEVISQMQEFPLAEGVIDSRGTANEQIINDMKILDDNSIEQYIQIHALADTADLANERWQNIIAAMEENQEIGNEFALRVRRAYSHIKIPIIKSTQDTVFMKLAERLFSNVLEEIKSNQAMFIDKVIDRQVLEFEVAKSAWQSVYGATADICIWNDLSLLDRQTFLLLAMKSGGQFVGYVNMHTVTKPNGEKILFLAGINPTDEYLATHNIRDVYDAVIRTAQTLARLSGADILAISTEKASISNRGQVFDFVKLQNYPHDQLGFNHEVGGRYTVNTYYVVWQKAARLITEEEVDKIRQELPVELQEILDPVKLLQLDRLVYDDIQKYLQGNQANCRYLQDVYRQVGNRLKNGKVKEITTHMAVVLFRYGAPLSRIRIDLKQEGAQDVEILYPEGIDIDGLKGESNEVLLAASGASSALSEAKLSMPGSSVGSVPMFDSFSGSYAVESKEFSSASSAAELVRSPESGERNSKASNAQSLTIDSQVSSALEQDVFGMPGAMGGNYVEWGSAKDMAHRIQDENNFRGRRDKYLEMIAEATKRANDFPYALNQKQKQLYTYLDKVKIKKSNPMAFHKGFMQEFIEQTLQPAFPEQHFQLHQELQGKWFVSTYDTDLGKTVIIDLAPEFEPSINKTIYEHLNEGTAIFAGDEKGVVIVYDLRYDEKLKSLYPDIQETEPHKDKLNLEAMSVSSSLKKTVIRDFSGRLAKNDPSLLKADLDTCLAVIGFNPISGERALAHFSLHGHMGQKFERNKQKYMQHAFENNAFKYGVEDKENWVFRIVPSHFIASSKEHLNLAINFYDLSQYLTGKLGIPGDNIKVYYELANTQKITVSIDQEGVIKVVNYGVSDSDKNVLKKEALATTYVESTAFDSEQRNSSGSGIEKKQDEATASSAVEAPEGFELEQEVKVVQTGLVGKISYVDFSQGLLTVDLSENNGKYYVAFKYAKEKLQRLQGQDEASQTAGGINGVRMEEIVQEIIHEAKTFGVEFTKKKTKSLFLQSQEALNDKLSSMRAVGAFVDKARKEDISLWKKEVEFLASLSFNDLVHILSEGENDILPLEDLLGMKDGAGLHQALVSYRQAKKAPTESAESPIEDVGGIDMRELPQHTKIEAIAASSPIMDGSVRPYDNKELQEFKNMLDAGMTPSLKRIEEFLESCSSSVLSAYTDQVLSLLAEMLRIEEGENRSTEKNLKEFLAVLESNKAPDELKLALSQIEISEKEPELLPN